MANKKDKIIIGENNEVNLVSPDLEKKVSEISKEKETKEVEEIKVSENISLVKPVEQQPLAVKMVKIKAKENHKCFIGGEWYYLIEGKQYNVPENVKAILLRADKLIPL